MIRIGLELPQPKPVGRSATLAYLADRVRKESDAAAEAVSVEATLVHVVLATRYAERLTECSRQCAISAGQAWVEEQRLW